MGDVVPFGSKKKSSEFPTDDSWREHVFDYDPEAAQEALASRRSAEWSLLSAPLAAPILVLILVGLLALL